MAEPARAASWVQRFPAVLRLESRRVRARIPYVQQLHDTDCGAACLAMVLRFHGCAASLDEVRERMGEGRDGNSLASLLDVARVYGLRGRAVRLELADLDYLEQGAILHWNLNHFVVLDRLRPGAVDIVDPAGGRRTVPLEEFGRSFTGVALVLEPTSTFETRTQGHSRIWQYLHKILTHHGTLTKILLTSLFAQLVALALPILTGTIVDRVVPRQDVNLLVVLASGVGVVILFAFLISFVRTHLFLLLRTNLDLQMTLDFVDHMMRLPFGFFQLRQTGDLMMRLNSNSHIRETLTTTALSAVMDGIMVVLFLVVLLVTHWGLALVVVALGALRVGIYILSRRRYRELMTESLRAQAESSNYQVQMISGVETLKSAGVERRAVEHWSNLLVDVMNVSLKQGRLSAVVDSIIGVLETASPLILLGYGAWLVLQEQLSLGMMLAMSALAMGFLGPLSKLVGVALQLQTLGSYIERVDDVLEKDPEQSGMSTMVAPRLTGRIELRNLFFRYTDGLPWAVEDVSVRIERGSRVAIVGPSGSGKSTLARLLVGLYLPTSGEILYDDQDVSLFEIGTVRRQIGFIPQVPFLFAATIRENVALSSPDAPLAAIQGVATLAHVHHEIMALPLNYSTPVSAGGGSLAGGQRQRIALARALLPGPTILVMDEATSHLDSLSEARIHENLGRLRSTRIQIAHRLSTVIDADQILVMDGGRIVERGTHRELMQADGLYTTMFRSQLGREAT